MLPAAISGAACQRARWRGPRLHLAVHLVFPFVTTCWSPCGARCPVSCYDRVKRLGLKMKSDSWGGVVISGCGCSWYRFECSDRFNWCKAASSFDEFSTPDDESCDARPSGRKSIGNRSVPRRLTAQSVRGRAKKTGGRSVSSF